MYDHTTDLREPRNVRAGAAGGGAGIAFVLLGIVLLLAILGWLFFGTADGTDPNGAAEPPVAGTVQDGTAGTALPEGTTTAPATEPAADGAAAPAPAE